jgi:hypothetical protein
MRSQKLQQLNFPAAQTIAEQRHGQLQSHHHDGKRRGQRQEICNNLRDRRRKIFKLDSHYMYYKLWNISTHTKKLSSDFKSIFSEVAIFDSLAKDNGK